VASTREQERGFTLIELSIVLVVIGLIVGGILVGQDMIKAAQTRATITQIEKFNTAVNTFRTKHGYLPGDIPAAAVTQFGFGVVPGPAHAGIAGLGDGNGLIEGYDWFFPGVDDNISSGEAAWFWEDLSSNSGLIEGAFNLAGGAIQPVLSGSGIGLLLPSAKLGGGNFFYVYAISGANYFGLSLPTPYIDRDGAIYGNPGLTVAQAYAIDTKIDDGLPQTGHVTAQYQDWTLGMSTTSSIWAEGPGVAGPSDTTALAGSSSTCFDNSGVTGATQRYSMEQSGGNGLNCGLSFRFQ
jgi:prepilin-type N-terminal cleavage/methylation domain-containing protein